MATDSASNARPGTTNGRRRRAAPAASPDTGGADPDDGAHSAADGGADQGPAVPGEAEPAFLPASTAAPGPSASAEPRFRIFIIDSGWHSVATKVLRENAAVMRALLQDDPAYVLDRKTSIDILRRHKELIGRDPVISVHDIRALDGSKKSRAHGLRLHLGLLRDEDSILQGLQRLTNFLARFRNAADFDGEVRRRLRREGIAGAITIIAGGAPENDLGPLP